MRHSQRAGRGGRTGVLATLAALTVAASATYTVQPGDTLSAVAARHGTSVRALARANDLADPDRIYAGQRLEVPGADGAAGLVHTVRRGEHLSGIARRYGVSVAAIAAANGLVDPDLVLAGSRLRVPGRAAPGAGSAAGGAPATRREVEALIERTARAHGWSPAFVKAVAWQESGWDNAVVSAAGARGIMQVLPGTAAFVSRSAGRPLDLDDPADNVLAGVLFLDHLYDLTGGDARLTLAGYYQGLRSVRERGLLPSTERYIANVLALRERFR